MAKCLICQKETTKTVYQIYRVGRDFGLIHAKESEIVFYFEQLQKEICLEEGENKCQ